MSDTDSIDLADADCGEDPIMWPRTESDAELLGEAFNELDVNCAYFEFLSQRFIEGEEDIIEDLKAAKDMEMQDIVDRVDPWVSFFLCLKDETILLMGGGVTRPYQLGFNHDQYYQQRTKDSYLKHQMRIKLVSCSFSGIKWLLRGEKTREKNFVENWARDQEQLVRRLASLNVRSYNRVTKALEELQNFVEDRGVVVTTAGDRWPRTDNFNNSYSHDEVIVFRHTNRNTNKRTLVKISVANDRSLDNWVPFGGQCQRYADLQNQFRWKLITEQSTLGKRNISIDSVHITLPTINEMSPQQRFDIMSSTTCPQVDVLRRNAIAKTKESIQQFIKNCTSFRSFLVKFEQKTKDVIASLDVNGAAANACVMFSDYLDCFVRICDEFILVMHGGLVREKFYSGDRVDNKKFIHFRDLDSIERTTLKVQVVSCSVSGLEFLFQELQYVSLTLRITSSFYLI